MSDVTFDSSRLCYPFLGKFKVTSPFGKRAAISTNEGYSSTDHKGIDLVSQDDWAVVSCSDGVVTVAKYLNGCGNSVWVKCDNGCGMIYQHLDKIYVSVGARVTCKQKIGLMGNTGNSSGPHLHFGVASNSDFRSYYDNEWFNPAFLWNIANPGEIKGKIFDGSGMITGYPAGITSMNNPNQDVSSAPSITVSYNYSSGGGYLGALVPSGEFYEVVDLEGTLGDWLYGRKYRVIVDIGNGKAFDVSELRCKFEITKDMTSLEGNTSKVTLYNLSPQTENLFIQEGQRIIVEAGYEGSQYGLIYSGNIIQALRSKENGVDYCLTLISMDADRYVTYGLINVSMTARQTMRQAVEALIHKSSKEVGQGFLTDTSIYYPRGKVMFGMSKDYLNQLAKSANSAFYIDDGKVNIVAPPDVEKGFILSFGPTTGLIGSPTQNELGISCKVLLNPKIKLNSLFHLDNTKIQNKEYSPMQGNGLSIRSLDTAGIYRAVKITHSGDTRDTEWYTSIDAVSQAGMLPSVMAGSSLYPW